MINSLLIQDKWLRLCLLRHASQTFVNKSLSSVVIPVGKYLYVVRCLSDIDECASNPCENGGSCVDDVGSFLCNCSAGYSDFVCSTGRPDILED